MELELIHNFVNPNDPQGRTYKQINAEKEHAYPVGALVEVVDTGIRLFVVLLSRDCDMSPLYWLSPDRDDTVQENKIMANRKWDGAYSEDSLIVIVENPT